MKGLVLAGGRGTRLRPLSNDTPKQLVPVANRPVLFHSLDTMREAGITEVGVVVAPGAEAIRDAAGNGARFGLRITYIEQAAPLGLAHAVRIAGEFLGDDDFLMQLGDNVILDSVTPLVEHLRTHRPAAAILLSKVAYPGNFGVAEVDADGVVVDLQEKPRHPRSDLAIVGVYAFSAAIHEAVRSIEPSWRGEHEITDALRWLIARHYPVAARVTTGYWRDTGRPEDLLDCNRALLERIRPEVRGDVDEASTLIGPVLIDDDVRIVRSRIVGPAVIGFGSRVSDSVVGPYAAVGSECEITESAVESSVLCEGASVHGVHTLCDSLVGRESKVRGRPSSPGGRRIVVGDHSEVSIDQ